MHLRNALVPLTIIVLIGHLAATNARAQDAGDDGGAPSDAGLIGGLDASTPSIDAGLTTDGGSTGGKPDGGDAGKITYPARGDANADLIDTYTSDHKSGCSLAGTPGDASRGLASLALVGLLFARSWRPRWRRRLPSSNGADV